MRVALVHNAKLPVEGYGGTERLVWWLAKGLSEMGVKVQLVAQRGSVCPFAEKVVTSKDPYDAVDGVEADVIHFFHTPNKVPTTPYVVTIGGNAQPGETFAPNTVFVSRNHALRHGSESFVHNGVDPADCLYSDKKDSYLVFLAKASWSVKNVKGAIRLARASKRNLEILGGSRILNPYRNVRWRGTVGGVEKALTLSNAAGLLFPVLWHEPFGLAVVEALFSGTPVLATPFGSLPELIHPSVGRICRTEDEFLMGISELSTFRPKDCRDWAMEHFHYSRMAQSYVQKYESVLEGVPLNLISPHHTPSSLTVFQV